MMTRTNLAIDDSIKEGMNELPKKISSSALFRWAVLAATTSDAEWRRECKARPELVEVTEFLRERMKKVFA
jgi:hypothetical protein